jgi:hypothetical protein
MPLRGLFLCPPFNGPPPFPRGKVYQPALIGDPANPRFLK